jgi:hypothetical protein
MLDRVWRVPSAYAPRGGAKSHKSPAPCDAASRKRKVKKFVENSLKGL